MQFGDINEVGASDSVKGGVDVNQSRLQRENMSVQIRKDKKNERLRQRRRGAGPSTGKANSSEPQPMTEKIPEYVQGVTSNDPQSQLEYTRIFRKLLSIEDEPPIDRVIAAGVVPRFVQFLRAGNSPQLQFEAAWALTNIASGSTLQTRVVIESGAIPIFVELLRSPEADVREQAVWALGNVAGDSYQCRDLVLQHNALPALLEQITPDAKSSMVRNATWTLSNFCRAKPPPDFNLVKPALAKLNELIYYPDVEVLTDACWALSYLSDGENQKIQAVIEAGVPARCIELLMHEKPAVKTPALRTVGNIVTGDDVQTQVIVSNGALYHLLALLNSDRKGIRKEACWTISNITAGNEEQIDEVIKANIIPVLIRLLETEQFDIKKEAAWAISNATSGGSPKHIKILVDHGCIKPFCDLLTQSEPKIVLVALEGLENILKVGEEDSVRNNSNMNGPPENPYANDIDACGGKESIYMLQNHSDPEVAKKARKICSYFDDEENDDDNMLAPNAGENQFSFNPPVAPGANQGGGFNFSGLQ